MHQRMFNVVIFYVRIDSISSLHNPSGLFKAWQDVQHRGQVPGTRTAKFPGAVQGAEPWTELEICTFPQQSYCRRPVHGAEFLVQAQRISQRNESHIFTLYSLLAIYSLQ